MAYKKIEHRQTVDFEVAGEQPVEQPYSATNSKIDPRSMRVTIYNGVLENVWVYGIKYNATGKLGKAKHSFPMNKEYAPAWVTRAITELGYAWPKSDDEIAAEYAKQAQQ